MLAGLILVRRSFGCMKNSSPGTHHSAVPGGYMDWTAYSMQSTQNKAVLQVWFFFIYEKKSRPHVPFPIALHKHTSPWWGGGRYKRIRERSPIQCSANLTMCLTLRSQWQCSKGRDCNSQNTDIFNDFKFLCFHVPFAAFVYLSLIPKEGFVVLLLAIEFISLASFALMVFFPTPE